MFKKIFELTPASERAEIYSTVALCLTGVLRLSELLAIFMLSSGLGTVLTRPLMADDVLGKTVGAYVGIFLMVLVLVFFRWPVLYLISQAKVAFGLDTRSLYRRLREQFLKGLVLIIPLWLISTWLFLALKTMDLMLWGALMLPALWLPIIFRHLWPYIDLKLNMSSFRDPTDEEISPKVASLLSRWGKQDKSLSDKITVSTRYAPEIKLPFLYGGKVLIQDRAFSVFSLASLTNQIAVSCMSGMGNVPLKIMLLRLFAVSPAYPIVVLLVNILGQAQHAYPYTISASLVPLFWLAALLAYWISEIARLYFLRFLAVELDAAVAFMTKSTMPFIAGNLALAHANMEPSTVSAWRQLFYERFSPETQVSRLVAKLDLLAKNFKNSGPAENSVL